LFIYSTCYEENERTPIDYEKGESIEDENGISDGSSDTFCHYSTKCSVLLREHY